MLDCLRVEKHAFKRNAFVCKKDIRKGVFGGTVKTLSSNNGIQPSHWKGGEI